MARIYCSNPSLANITTGHQPLNIANWLNSQKNSRLSRLENELLLAHLLQVERSWLFAHDDEKLTQAQFEQLQKLTEQAHRGVPIAYLIGVKNFWTLQLKVNHHTLIPRPETELIIETALSLNTEFHNILDLGTGSGAIALSLAKEFPQAKVTATDQSLPALKIAEQNAKLNQVDNIKLLHSNWFEQIKDQSFDLIVSNPPYIDVNDKHLKSLSYEPQTALIAKRQGYADLATIIEQSPSYLRQSGYLILEHGYNQAEKVRQMMLRQFTDIQTATDLSGQPRATWGKAPPKSPPL